MPMIRTVHNKDNPFILLNKQALWDKDLSLEAVGLWARLLSRPDDWEVSVSELCKSCDCNPKKIYKLLHELVNAGYAFRHQDRVDSEKSNKKKVFSKWLTYVFEFKVNKEEIQKMFPLGTFRHADFPLSGKRETTNIYSNSSKEELETEKEATKKPPNPQTGEEPDGSGLREKMAFGKFVSLEKQDYYLLCSRSGQEAVDGIIEEINDFLSSTGKKPYRDYAATIRNWLRRRKEQAAKTKPQNSQGKETADLNEIQKKNWHLNHDLVNELKIDCPNKCSGLHFYYKHHVLKDKNNPNFDISALIDHRTFCKYLDKHYKLNTEEVIFHGKI